MRRLIIILSIAVVAGALYARQIFDSGAFEAIFKNPSGLQGLSRNEVRAKLGEPNEFKAQVLPKAPFWGPQESLVKYLDSGQKFEEWIYHRNKMNYFIWYGGSKGGSEPEGDWKVLAAAVFPEGASF